MKVYKKCIGKDIYKVKQIIKLILVLIGFS